MSKIKGKILIIDDEEKLRKLLLRIITLEGYEVSEAGSLKEGSKMLEKQHYHLVLCDVKLPMEMAWSLFLSLKPNTPPPKLFPLLPMAISRMA